MGFKIQSPWWLSALLSTLMTHLFILVLELLLARITVYTLFYPKYHILKMFSCGSTVRVAHFPLKRKLRM